MTCQVAAGTKINEQEILYNARFTVREGGREGGREGMREGGREGGRKDKTI